MLAATPHRLATLALALVLALGPGAAPAHDASAWGGLFRTRDAGGTWLHVNPASFVSGALALAVSPVDPHHLLLATDTGLSRSRNGGRDWVIEAPDVFVGPAFAAAFDADGQRALVSSGTALFRSDSERWLRLRSPAGSVPARALVSASIRGRVYLAGRTGLYRSDDWGQSWVSIGGALQAEHVSVVVVPRGHPDDVYAVAGGRSWVSTDTGRTWQLRVDGLPRGSIEVVAVDPFDANRLWSVVTDQVFRSDDQGRRWSPVGDPVPERPVAARGLAVVDHVILMATDRGVYRSPDDGGRWTLSSDTLPAHLPAGLLVRDPEAPATVYAGFALTSTEELSRRATEGGGALGRMAPGALAGGLVLLALVLLAAGAVARRRTRTDQPAPRSVSR